VIGRVAALAAIGIAVIAVAVILLSGGKSYQVKAIFQNASQIVTGDQVEVAGNPIGTVSDISLTPNGLAALTLSIDDSNYMPLHEGTIATVRQASLSGLANRYIDLRMGPGNAPKIPNGGEITTRYTTSAVDLDQLFNTLDAPTRKGLQNVFQGSASQYAKQGQVAQAAWEYLNPALAASSMLFRELNRDTAKFTNFIVKSGNLVTDLAQRSSDLSGLVENLSTTFSALNSQRVALGQSIQRLPGFMRLANTTFVNLRSALDQLTPLVDVSKPVVPKVQALLEQLRPLAHDAVPTIRDLANIISRPGPNNDLIELTSLGVPLAAVTVKPIFANGKLRRGAFPESVIALNNSTPELAVGRPYAVDLTGWFEGYSHPGIYDANGGVSRAGALVVGVSSITGTPTGIEKLNACTPLITQILGGTCTKLNNLVTNPTGRLAFASNVLTTGYGDRCPGSMERSPSDQPGTSAAYFPYKGYPCTPSEGPTGP
jgi:phospholipid/cholesterol/gamma-HCH transport system substrate-binding protein